MLFENLEIIKPIQKALKEEGYKKTTPIQEKSIPYILDGRDLVGCAQTGTGKQQPLQFLYYKIFLRIRRLIKILELLEHWY